MFRFAVAPLAASVVLAAPVPDPGKLAKERAAVLTDLGVPDKQQKLPAVPPAYLPDATPDDADRVALRAACGALAKLLKAHHETPRHGTVNGGGNLDAVKKAIRAAQIEVARRTVDIAEAVDDLTALVEKVGDREKSPRWQATSRLLLATARQELVVLNEYNQALGHIITEMVELPPVTESVDALKLEAVPKLRSARAYRDLAAQAEKELAEVAKDHPNTPWAALAIEAGDRHLGLTWVPVKVGK